MHHNRRGGSSSKKKCNTIDHHSFACCTPWGSPLDEQKG